MYQTMIDNLLVEGLDDWIPLAAIDGFARRLVGEDPHARREACLNAIGALLDHGYASVGDIVLNLGFVPWDLPNSVAIAKVAEALQQDEPGNWWFDAWLSLTEAGEAAAAEVSNKAT
jgi:hypothetical protein